MRLTKWRRLVSPSNWPSLRARMTISYVVVTVGTVFTFLLLIVLASGAISAFVSASNTVSSDFLTAIQRQAQTYAMVAAYQARSDALDPQTSFIPGQAHSIAVANPDNQNSEIFARYIATTSPDPSAVVIALLVTPDGRTLASSYPSRYAPGTAVSSLAPVQTRAIAQALAGRPSRGTGEISSTIVGYDAETVWSESHQPIGAIFLQAPIPTQEGFLSRLWDTLSRVLLLLIIVTPIGVLFGWIATRSMVRRVQRLVAATTRFADGDYTQRVAEVHQDEIGQLERQFNVMAGRLVESLALHQQLAEQNARLEERSRISRELHDAVSQDLFSLRMLADGLHQATQAGTPTADLQPHIALLEQTTGNMTREMRALLLESRPMDLENGGLSGALQKLAHVYSTRLGIEVTTDLSPARLDVNAEHALLRIAQEALTNAARHSDATHISLSLKNLVNLITLTVTDNGGGFDADAGTERYGLGLRIMRERAEELHGAFVLKTTPGHGTSITATLP
jgi:two-component system, NarL family, sensor histidine kinase LiaS